MSARFSFVSALLLFLLTTASGCAQAAGEVCQVAADCESGLVCCKESASDPVSERGICRTTAGCEAFLTTDAGEPVDAAPRDSGIDAARDAGGDDAGGEDAGGDDAGGDDAGGDDAGSDAGTDAGSDVDAGEDGGGA